MQKLFIRVVVVGVVCCLIRDPAQAAVTRFDDQALAPQPEAQSGILHAHVSQLAARAVAYLNEKGLAHREVTMDSLTIHPFNLDKRSSLYIGAGKSRRSVVYALMGFDVTAIDSNAEDVKMINKWIHLYGIGEEIEKRGGKFSYIVQNINEWHPGRTFDYITALDFSPGKLDKFLASSMRRSAQLEVLVDALPRLAHSGTSILAGGPWESTNFLAYFRSKIDWDFTWKPVSGDLLGTSWDALLLTGRAA